MAEPKSGGSWMQHAKILIRTSDGQQHVFEDVVVSTSNKEKCLIIVRNDNKKLVMFPFNNIIFVEISEMS